MIGSLHLSFLLIPSLCPKLTTHLVNFSYLTYPICTQPIYALRLTTYLMHTYFPDYLFGIKLISALRHLFFVRSVVKFYRYYYIILVFQFIHFMTLPPQLKLLVLNRYMDITTWVTSVLISLDSFQDLNAGVSYSANSVSLLKSNSVNSCFIVYDCINECGVRFVE